MRHFIGNLSSIVDSFNQKNRESEIEDEREIVLANVQVDKFGTLVELLAFYIDFKKNHCVKEPRSDASKSFAVELTDLKNKVVSFMMTAEVHLLATAIIKTGKRGFPLFDWFYSPNEKLRSVAGFLNHMEQCQYFYACLYKVNQSFSSFSDTAFLRSFSHSDCTGPVV